MIGFASKVSVTGNASSSSQLAELFNAANNPSAEPLIGPA